MVFAYLEQQLQTAFIASNDSYRKIILTKTQNQTTLLNSSQCYCGKIKKQYLLITRNLPYIAFKKYLHISRTKRAFNMILKKTIIIFNFKGLSVVLHCLRLASRPLNA